MNAALSRRTILVFLVLLLATAACAFPAFGPTQQPTQPAVNPETQVAMTVEAMMTQAAGSQPTQPSGQPTAVAGQSTATVAPPTVAPSATPQPTATTIILPSPTATQVCDQAAFISDVSVPDGTNIAAGTQFVKTWRLKNVGACTWTGDYAVVFESGSSMEGPASQKLNTTVAPGQTVDISVTLRAPTTTGTYRGYWKMRNASGVLFGLGAASQRFYVDIKVVPVASSGNGYDFAANVCLAEWTGNGNAIPCSGTDGADAGFVLYQAKPKIETGSTDDEPGLLTNPPKQTDATIRGKYPAYTVKAGDHFKALINCEYNAKNCNVRFQLDYTVDGGAITTLAAWNEAYEGNYTQADVDLSSLAGKNVRFILTVLANGGSDQDRALWVAPRIVNVTP